MHLPLWTHRKHLVWKSACGKSCKVLWIIHELLFKYQPTFHQGTGWRSCHQAIFQWAVGRNHRCDVKKTKIHLRCQWVSVCVKRLIKQFITSSVWVLGPLCATGLCQGHSVCQWLRGLGTDRSLNEEGTLTDEAQGEKTENGEGRGAGVKDKRTKKEWYVVLFWGVRLEMIYKSCENPF